MPYPKVKFVVDKEVDYQNCLDFREYAPKYYEKFLQDKLVPILPLSIDEQNIRIKQFVDKHFAKPTIFEVTAETQTRWDNIAPKYFAIVDKIFKNRSWPKGKYIGYASVFTMFPRHIDNKTFHFAGFRTETGMFNLPVTAHECLHFMFFDYVEEKYGITEDTTLEGENSKYVWNVSETFNCVIEKWPPYQYIFNTKGDPYDKAHEMMLPEMLKLWNEKEDVAYLLDHYFKSIV